MTAFWDWPWHHVHEREAAYWRDWMAGFGVDAEAIAWVRRHGANPYTTGTGTVFIRQH